MQRILADPANAEDAQAIQRELQWIAIRLRLDAIGKPQWCEGKSAATIAAAAAVQPGLMREVRWKAQHRRMQMAEGEKRCAKNVTKRTMHQVTATAHLSNHRLADAAAKRDIPGTIVHTARTPARDAMSRATW